MRNNITTLIVRFFLLILVQVVILNNVAFFGFINPFLYVLFIVLLPFETPKWLSLIVAFILGLIIDSFSSTLGMHIAACLFMAFIRQVLLNILTPRDGYEFGLQPSIKDMGISWFLFYSGILVVAHHLFLFFVEVFRFSEFFQTAGRALLSAIFTLLLIILTQLFSYSKK